MEFKEILSVSGKSGLYKIEKPRQDGIIATELGESKRTFLSMRKHNFTPLENIGVYLVSGDTIDLPEVFQRMVNEDEKRPSSDDDPDSIRFYFDGIIPAYDEDRFKMSDMKKILQWFEIIENNELLDVLSISGEEEEEE